MGVLIYQEEEEEEEEEGEGTFGYNKLWQQLAMLSHTVTFRQHH